MKKSLKVMTIPVRQTERHVPLEEKVCRLCGKSFLGSKTKQYCSRACVRKAAYWRNPEAYRQSRLKSYRRQKGQGAKK